MNEQEKRVRAALAEIRNCNAAGLAFAPNQTKLYDTLESICKVIEESLEEPQHAPTV